MHIIIPARLGSSRVHHKLLQDLDGQFVIERTVNSAKIAAQKYDCPLTIATDSTIIRDLFSKDVTVNVAYTPELNRLEPSNGTERVAIAAEHMRVLPSELVINIQGDKWGLVPEAVDELVDRAYYITERNASRKHTSLFCLCETAPDEVMQRPETVKVVTTPDDIAVFFTRHPISASRKHCGIYAYHGCFLRNYLIMPYRTLERLEGLEQMRVIENGGKVFCPRLEQLETAGPSINTETDIQEANVLLRQGR